MILIKSEEFIHQEISIKDDALHKFPLLSQIETWYYDSLFNNEYSVVFLVNVFSIFKTGFVLISLYIYKDNILLKSIKKDTF